MMQARRENAAYVEMVETGKKLDKIEERKRKRGDETLVSSSKNKSDGSEKRHKHHQRRPMKEGTKATKSAILGGLLDNFGSQQAIKNEPIFSMRLLSLSWPSFVSPWRPLSTPCSSFTVSMPKRGPPERLRVVEPCVIGGVVI